MPTIQDQNLSATQVIQLTQAMLSVALVDGMHPAEAALIGQFYESSRSADMPTTSAMLSGTHAFDAQAMTGCPADVADTVVLMCLMTGHADGRLSDGERALVQSFATALNVDAARFDALLGQVRDELIGALSHLPDAGSVANVVRELGAGGCKEQQLGLGAHLVALGIMDDDVADLLPDLRAAGFPRGHDLAFKRLEMGREARDLAKEALDWLVSDGIADQVGERVVYALEVIDVDQQQGKPLLASQASRQDRIKAAPVVELGQRVRKRLAGQFLIELFAARLRLLQVFDQVLILEAPQQTAINQPIDLPRHHAQRTEQDQTQPAPAPRLIVAAPEQVADRWQQARQGQWQQLLSWPGKTEVRLQNDTRVLLQKELIVLSRQPEKRRRLVAPWSVF